MRRASAVSMTAACVVTALLSRPVPAAEPQSCCTGLVARLCGGEGEGAAATARLTLVVQGMMKSRSGAT